MAAPTRLGKYEIRRELGKGSMGVVYEGFDPLIERSVAVKIIRPDQLGPQSAELMARLRREAQAVGRLNHPGIVAIYDYGEDSSFGGINVAFIAMELIDGKELKHYFDTKHRFPPYDIARIMGDVLAALQHAHERGVTHRDIKPSNVILLKSGAIKVADFGVARLDNSQLTQAGTMIGTPMYMAPEQILGLPVDGRSDLFSCGVVLYQFLTGEKPFVGSVTTVMQKVLHEEPRPATQLNPSLSPAWDTVLRKAMAKKPADRYQTATALADAIRAAAAVKGDEATVVLPTMKPGATLTPAGATLASAALAAGGSIIGAAASHAAANSTGASLGNGGRTPPPSPPPPPSELPDIDLGPAFEPTVADPPAALRSPPPPAPTSGAPAPAERSMPAAATPPPAGEPPPPVWRASAPVPMPQPAKAVSKKPATALILGSVAAIVALLAAGGYWWSQSGRSPENESRTAGVAPTPAYAPAPQPAPAPAPATSLITSSEAPPAASEPAAAPVAAAPSPAPAPAPATALATAPAPAVASAPAPAAPSDFSADWQARLAKLDAARSPLAVPAAFGLLLDANSADDRRIAADLEAMLKARPPHSAFALGVADGQLRFNWQQGRPSAAQAQEAALRRCREMTGADGGCAAIVVDGEFRREAFGEPVHRLGAQNVPAVRSRFMRALDRALAEQRAKEPPLPIAKAPDPVRETTGAPPPVSRPTAASKPVNEWVDAVAQLRANEARLTLASGLELLLQVKDPADVDRLNQLQAAVKRLRYKSAMALGVRDGQIAFGFGSGERMAQWAEEKAAGDCNSRCVVVALDGSFRSGAFIDFAGRLGGRNQTQVRETFLRELQRALQAGI